jgi:hypothetical protein
MVIRGRAALDRIRTSHLKPRDRVIRRPRITEKLRVNIPTAWSDPVEHKPKSAEQERIMTLAMADYDHVRDLVNARVTVPGIELKILCAAS